MRSGSAGRAGGPRPLRISCWETLAERITGECDEAAKLWASTLNIDVEQPPRNPSNAEPNAWERQRPERLARLAVHIGAPHL